MICRDLRRLTCLGDGDPQGFFVTSRVIFLDFFRFSFASQLATFLTHYNCDTCPSFGVYVPAPWQFIRIFNSLDCLLQNFEWSLCPFTIIWILVRMHQNRETLVPFLGLLDICFGINLQNFKWVLNKEWPSVRIKRSTKFKYVDPGRKRRVICWSEVRTESFSSVCFRSW